MKTLSWSSIFIASIVMSSLKTHAMELSDKYAMCYVAGFYVEQANDIAKMAQKKIPEGVEEDPFCVEYIKRARALAWDLNIRRDQYETTGADREIVRLAVEYGKKVRPDFFDKKGGATQ